MSLILCNTEREKIIASVTMSVGPRSVTGQFYALGTSSLGECSAGAASSQRFTAVWGDITSCFCYFHVSSGHLNLTFHGGCRWRREVGKVTYFPLAANLQPLILHCVPPPHRGCAPHLLFCLLHFQNQSCCRKVVGMGDREQEGESHVPPAFPLSFAAGVAMHACLCCAARCTHMATHAAQLRGNGPQKKKSSIMGNLPWLPVEIPVGEWNQPPISKQGQ